MDVVRKLDPGRQSDLGCLPERIGALKSGGQLDDADGSAHAGPTTYLRRLARGASYLDRVADQIVSRPDALAKIEPHDIDLFVIGLISEHNQLEPVPQSLAQMARGDEFARILSGDDGEAIARYDFAELWDYDQSLVEAWQQYVLDRFGHAV